MMPPTDTLNTATTASNGSCISKTQGLTSLPLTSSAGVEVRAIALRCVCVRGVKSDAYSVRRGGYEDHSLVEHCGTTSTLKFAKSNNKTLWADLTQSTDAYRLTGSVLTKSGVTQTVNLTDPNSRDGLVQRIDDLQAVIQAATTVNQLKSAVQDLRQIHRDAIRNGPPFPDE
jgi:hypothetical protein